VPDALLFHHLTALSLVDRECTITLKNGEVVTVRGHWNEDDDEDVIICIPDSGNSVACDGKITQFDSIHQGKGGISSVERVLTIGLGIDVDKNPSKFVSTVIEILDFLGLAQVTLYGRDAGAMIAIAVKLLHPKRVRKLVLENKRDNYDEKRYKKLVKKDPSIDMSVWGGPWSLLMVMDKSKGTCDMPGMKKWRMKKNKTTLLWPNQNKGRPTRSKNPWSTMVQMTLGDVKVLDSHGYEPADYAKVLI
jgi:hypothetical protein